MTTDGPTGEPPPLAARLRPLADVADGTPGRTLAALLDLAQRREIALYVRRAAFDLGWPGPGWHGSTLHLAPPPEPEWRAALEAGVVARPKYAPDLGADELHRLERERLLREIAAIPARTWHRRRIRFDPPPHHPLRLGEWPGSLATLADGAHLAGRFTVSVQRATVPQLFRSDDEIALVTDATPRAPLGLASLLVDVDELAASVAARADGVSRGNAPVADTREPSTQLTQPDPAEGLTDEDRALFERVRDTLTDEARARFARTCGDLGDEDRAPFVRACALLVDPEADPAPWHVKGAHRGKPNGYQLALAILGHEDHRRRFGHGKPITKALAPLLDELWHARFGADRPR